MKVIDFLKLWKKITFYTREFDREQYDFKYLAWIWDNNLLTSYNENRLSEEFKEVLDREILFVEQREFEPRPDIEIPQITHGIVITLKEKAK